MNTQNIADLIRQLVADDEQIYSLPCEVVEIDADGLATLDPLNGDPELIDVKLIAGASETPLLITPKTGSVVIATFLSKDTAFISLYSEIETIQLRGEQFGGLIKIEELTAQLEKLNTFLTTFTNVLGGPPIPEPGNGAPSALQIALNGALGALPLANYGNIENENVKHG